METHFGSYRNPRRSNLVLSLPVRCMHSNSLRALREGLREGLREVLKRCSQERPLILKGYSERG